MTSDFRAHPPTLPTASPIARPVRANMAPDWDTFPDQIVCPLCGYNLRGLVEARCPECGSVFAWNDLLDPRQRTHDYLYEYCDGHRARSVLRTMIGGLTPWRFWRNVLPVLPIRIGRLRQYLGMIFGAMFVSFWVGLLAIYAWQPRMIGWRARGWGFNGAPLAPWTWSLSDLEKVLAVNSHLVTAIIWFVSTFAAIHIFALTMRRKQIRSVHIFRCFVYSCDVFIWLAGALMLLDVWEALAFDDPPVVTQYLALIGAILIVDLRLVIALREYLQFPRPGSVVVATQVVAALVIFNIYMGLVWL